MPLVTGETWLKVYISLKFSNLKVPEIVEIRFVGELKKGIGGKDVILYVLGELKRNTVAFERAVEVQFFNLLKYKWTGPGLKYLTCDARFAISNMVPI